MTTYVNGYVTLRVIHHSSMYDGHWSCGKRDISYSVCHMTAHDLVIEGSCDFMDRGSSLSVTNLPILVAMGIVLVKI